MIWSELKNNDSTAIVRPKKIIIPFIILLFLEYVEIHFE
jgi:hypothetical protein